MNKNFIKKIYFRLQYVLKKGQYLVNIARNNYLPILNLHRVSTDTNPFYPSLSPRLFEELLRFVTKEFNVITFREIEKHKNSKKPNLILSFDDGFYDFLEYAVPLLEKYNVRVNQNVIPSCIESGRPVWDVQLGDLLNQVPAKMINRIKLPGYDLQLTDSNKSQYGLSLTRYLKQRPFAEREALWTEFEKLIVDENVRLTRMLNKEEVIQIAQTHEIGAHSYSHESMALESKEFFENDFERCLDYFTNELDLPLDIYAFPSGSYRDEQLNFLQQNGVKYILLVDEQYSDNYTNIYKRFTYYGDSIYEIKMRALGWHR